MCWKSEPNCSAPTAQRPLASLQPSQRYSHDCWVALHNRWVSLQSSLSSPSRPARRVRGTAAPCTEGPVQHAALHLLLARALWVCCQHADLAFHHKLLTFFTSSLFLLGLPTWKMLFFPATLPHHKSFELSTVSSVHLD